MRSKPRPPFENGGRGRCSRLAVALFLLPSLSVAQDARTPRGPQSNGFGEPLKAAIKPSAEARAGSPRRLANDPGFGEGPSSSSSGALDTTYASTVNPNVSVVRPGNGIAFCPALSCIYGPASGGVNSAYFGKQRATGLFSGQTLQDGSAEEQTLAITTTVGTGYVKPYAAARSYSVGDNVTVGNATYRAIVAGTTGASSPPPGIRPSSLPFTAKDGSVTWTWINDGVLSAKAGYYNELNVIPGGGQIHGGVTNVQLQPGVVPGFIAADEINLTNNSGTDCAIGTANCIGSFIVMGGTNKNTTALDIHGASSTAGSFAVNWGQRFSGASLASEAIIEVNTAGSKYGVSLGAFQPASFEQSAFNDASTAPVGLLLGGTYAVAQIQGAGWSVNPAGQIATPSAKLTGYTVASLPSCNAAAKGTMTMATDVSDAPTYRQTRLAGGGSVAVPVFCNGLMWEAH